MANDFQLFPELPKELQIHIWRCAVNNIERRAFTIRRAPSRPGRTAPDPQDPNYWLTYQEEWTTRKNSDSQPPSMLSATVLSRQICKEHYKLAFGGIDNAPVWFNFQKDILSVQKKFLAEMEIASAAFTATVADETSLRADCAKVEKLLEYCNFLGFSLSAPYQKARRFRAFENLKNIGKVALDPWGNIVGSFDVWIASDQELEAEWKSLGKPTPTVSHMWSKKARKFDK
ncbi:hypothetical protein ACEPPN_015753 [Leptodophora sp. 'Broadleaf-Isolate-01']